MRLAGLSLGAAFAYSGYLCTQDPKLGHGLALGTSMVLTGAMGARFVKTQKLMPAGVMAVAGTLSSVYQFQKFREWS